MDHTFKPGDSVTITNEVSTRCGRSGVVNTVHDNYIYVTFPGEYASVPFHYNELTPNPMPYEPVPGDKVYVELDNYDIKRRGLNPKDFEGKVFTVAEYEKETNFCTVIGVESKFYSEQISLAPAPTDFAVGDKVMVKLDAADIEAGLSQKEWEVKPCKVTKVYKDLCYLNSIRCFYKSQLTKVTKPTSPTASTPVSTSPPPMQLILDILRSGESPILVGPTGSGKTTTLKREVLPALGLSPEDITIVQVSRETSRYDLLGYKNSSGVAVEGFLTRALRSPKHLVVIDELDKGNENTLLVLKGIFAGYIETPCGNFPIDRKNFYLAATANTVGAGASMDYNAAVRQDQALLNEFITVSWDYSDEIELKVIKECIRPDRQFYLNLTYNQLECYYMDSFRELRKACSTNSFSEIFSTRQLRQAISLMTVADWNFSSVILTTSLRERDVVSLETYKPILTKYDRLFRKTKAEVEKEEKEAKERETRERQIKSLSAAPDTSSLLDPNKLF